jgi:hypothetical protein
MLLPKIIFSPVSSVIVDSGIILLIMRSFLDALHVGGRWVW